MRLRTLTRIPATCSAVIRTKPKTAVSPAGGRVLLPATYRSGPRSAALPGFRAETVCGGGTRGRPCIVSRNRLGKAIPAEMSLCRQAQYRSVIMRPFIPFLFVPTRAVVWAKCGRLNATTVPVGTRVPSTEYCALRTVRPRPYYGLFAAAYRSCRNTGPDRTSLANG